MKAFIAVLIASSALLPLTAKADSTSVLLRFSGPAKGSVVYKTFEKQALELLASKVADGTVDQLRIMDRYANAIDICATSSLFYTPAISASMDKLEIDLQKMVTADFTVYTQRTSTQKGCETIFPSGR